MGDCFELRSLPILVDFSSYYLIIISSYQFEGRKLCPTAVCAFLNANSYENVIWVEWHLLINSSLSLLTTTTKTKLLLRMKQSPSCSFDPSVCLRIEYHNFYVTVCQQNATSTTNNNNNNINYQVNIMNTWYWYHKHYIFN